MVFSLKDPEKIKKIFFLYNSFFFKCNSSKMLFLLYLVPYLGNKFKPTLPIPAPTEATIPNPPTTIL